MRPITLRLALVALWLGVTTAPSLATAPCGGDQQVDINLQDEQDDFKKGAHCGNLVPRWRANM